MDSKNNFAAASYPAFQSTSIRILERPAAPLPADLSPLSTAEYLRRMFRFTPTEAALAELLIARKSLSDCGAELGISIHTVRSHLKKLMIKTRTNRQGALIGLILVALQHRLAQFSQ